MSHGTNDSLYCPYCGGRAEPEDLYVTERCSFCGRELHEAIRHFNEKYEIAEGPGKAVLNHTRLYLHVECWEQAKAGARIAIDLDPSNFQGYLYLLMAEVQASYIVELEDCSRSFANYPSYRMFCKYAPPLLRGEVNHYLQKVIRREGCRSSMEAWETEELPKENLREFPWGADEAYIYGTACNQYALATTYGDYEEAKAKFAQIRNYRDARYYEDNCIKKAGELRAEADSLGMVKALGASLCFLGFLVWICGLL